MISLSSTTRKHLILTGKNGSGKTSLLLALKQFLQNIDNGAYAHYNNYQSNYEKIKKQLSEIPLSQEHKVYPVHGGPIKVNQKQMEAHLQSQLASALNTIKQFGGVKIDFNVPVALQKEFKEGNFIIAFFEAKRNTNLEIPKGITKVKLKKYYSIIETARQEFIQYIVNLKADRSFARDEGDEGTVAKIDEWFQVFEKNLFKLFDIDSMALSFDRKSYNFNIIEPGKAPYNLNQLSDGYSAILSIVTELILRMEEHRTKSYDVQGVVLVDEIETHLHIELQKRILPFLTAFFPNIQFIVSTHSPFVITSIQNAVICDLEKKVVTTDLSGYSYDTIVESYFDSDKYSSVLKMKIDEYEKLLARRTQLNNDEKKSLSSLIEYLESIPKYLSDEFAVKMQQIKLRQLDDRKG